MNARTIGNAILEGGIEGFIIKALDAVKEPLKKSGEDFLKAHTGGRGVHDEALFQGACSYAMTEFKVTPAEIAKIIIVINSLPANERRRVIEIIGQSEQVCKIETPIVENGVAVTDKKGKQVFKETTVTANIRGAQVIALLAKMNKNQIKAFFQASNSLDTSDKRIKETAENIAKGYNAVVNHPEVKKVLDEVKTSVDSLKGDLEARMTQENFLDRWARKMRR